MKRVRRWLFVAGMLLSLLLGAATVVFWVRGTDWIRRTKTFSNSSRNDDGEIFTDQGIEGVGLYSHDGRIGILRFETGSPALEPDEVAAIGPPDPAEIGWFWTRTGNMDFYMGGIPDYL